MPSFRPFLATAAVMSLLLPGCGGRKEPEPLPSQTTTQLTPQLEPPPQLPPPIREVQPTRRAEVTVIDPGEDPSAEPQTLIEASRLAKAQKESQQAPMVEINDENLHEYAEKGDVIVLESEPAAPAPEAFPEPPSASGGSRPSDGIRDEEFWRTGALELRMGWRRTVDQISELELESAALRQQFYAEEDPYLRDSQIKPAWDRILDRLDILRDRAGRYEQELDLFLEDGRRSGAAQGWLNQGWELEPTDDERAKVGRHRVHEAVDVPTLAIDPEATDGYESDDDENDG